VHEHESSVCLSSLVIGALAGAGLALLVAPRAGAETRRLLSEGVREGTDRARDLAARAKEQGRRWAEAAAEKGREAAEGVESEVSEAAP
jgi:gas vesicle protein